MVEPIHWQDGRLRLLDQTRLPAQEQYIETADYRDVCEAIRRLAVRGAPALGVAGAYALVLAANQLPDAGFLAALEERAREIASTRPTAGNLSWGVHRALRAAQRAPEPAAAREAVLHEAGRIQQEDLAANRRLGQLGADLLPQRATVLTHCNAGALATAGYGTALGVLRAARERGKSIAVLADETRPLLQGARLTAWELIRDGFSVTLIADAAAGAMMQRGLVDCVLVGADRIAANGDVANKIGTYPLAVLADVHGIPFYVAAPLSTIDLDTPSGEAIPIEERDPAELLSLAGVPIAPDGASARNPAFDVTPARLVTAIITEAGIARPPYATSLRLLTGSAAAPAAAGQG